MSLIDDQPAREIGWSALKQMGLILEGSYAVYLHISIIIESMYLCVRLPCR